MSEGLLSAPVSVMVPLPLSHAAPLTAPLPRAHLWRTSETDRRRRSSDFLRRPISGPIANTEVSGALKSRGISRSGPSSPNVPHTVLIRPLPAIPRHAPASEDGTPAPLSSMRTQPDRRARENNTESTVAMESRGLSRTMPSSPRVPHPPPWITYVPQRAPASEDRAPATPSSMRTQPDRRMRQNSNTSGLSTEWMSSDHDSITTVGTVRPHITPNPTRDMAVRASIVLERLGSIAEVLPPSPELGANLMRKDSGVLGKDDLVYMPVRGAKNMF